MKSTVALCGLLALSASSSFATPLPRRLSFSFSSSSVLGTRAAGESAQDQILEIAPSSASCASAPVASECATSNEAAPFLVGAMQKYGVSDAHELAALLSVVAYESGEFKYNTNHFPAPGQPGQGTRNMQMANYNMLYAKSIPELAGPLAAITTAATTDGLSEDQLNAIRALVLPDKYSFASAAWFLTTQCPAGIRTGLRVGGQSGYEAYLTECLGTTSSSDRLAYWTKANSAFGLS